MINPNDWSYHWVTPYHLFSGGEGQESPTETTRHQKETLVAAEHVGVNQKYFYRKHPFPIPYILLPSYSAHSLRLSSLPVSSLKFSLAAFNPLRSPKRAINCVLYSLRMCHTLVYITSFSLSDLLI